MVSTEKHIFDMKSAFPVNFNKQFWKFINPQFDELFLKAGIFQYYPDWVTIKRDEIEIKTESAIFVMPKYVPPDYHEFFVNLSSGACI